MNLGLLSTARINALLVQGARAVEGVEVVAVGSRDSGRAGEHAEALGVGRWHGSYAAVIEDPGVDAVYVALPNSLHVEWSIRALRAGKHVLCEKPMARDPAAVAEAFTVAEEQGRVLLEAFMWRHTPQAARLRELTDGLGPLRGISASFSFTLDRPGDVRLSSALEGGALMDVGCYCVSAARLLGGEPQRFSGRRVTGADGVDLTFAGVMGHPGGVLSHFDCSFQMPARSALEVVGAEGVLRLPDPWHSRAPVIELHRPDGSSERIDPGYADPYACELRDFAAAIAGEAPLPFGRDDAVAQARALAGLHESALADGI